MKKLISLFLSLAVLALCAGCAPKVYTPTGETTGNDALDEAVLALLQEICDPKASLTDNLGHAYDFVCTGITYRAGTADTSEGFTEELTESLALELLQKRKGNCDAQAALMAVLLRRMGCEARIVQGTFLRAAGSAAGDAAGSEQAAEPVGHAWVYAVVNGTGCWFDPLYGSHFAQDPRDYFMADDALLAQTHQYDAAAMQ